MSLSYIHINETVEVQLFNPTSHITYTLYLSEENAKKCQDEAFAQSLLFHAKVIKAQKKNDSHNAVSQVDVSEAQQDSKISSGGSWLVNKTDVLISSYETFCKQFEHATKRKHVWHNISNHMLSLGIEKSAEKCEIKLRNLLRRYKSVKDNKKATGRGPTRFLYLDRIDEILGSKPSVSCPHTFFSNLDSNNEVEGSSSSSTSEAVNVDNGNYETECTGSLEDNANNDPHGISKERKRNSSNELRQLKIRYFKKKEEGESERGTSENEKEINRIGRKKGSIT